MDYLQKIKERSYNFISRVASGHVLLYHACYSEIPVDLSKNLHNVKPDVMYKQLKWYKENFDIVTLDEFFARSGRRGLATVTFDDAYSSVFDEGLEVLEQLNIPATIFVIGSTLNGRVFWRDKIRFIESRGVTKDFVEYLRSKNADAGITSQNFYEHSKKNSFISITPNELLVNLMDDFLVKLGMAEEVRNYCACDDFKLISHPLVTYGNHTTNHFVLDTLSAENISREIRNCHDVLQSYSDIATSNYFSVPFGGTKSLSENMSDVLKEIGYKGILLSTNRINMFGKLSSYNGLKVANRYLMPDSVEGMIQKINHMTYREIR